MTENEIKFKQIFPNSLTMLGLAFGLSSLNMAYWGQWQMALTFILLAAVFDFLDGKIARLLGLSSKFGVELDSLADLVSFGIAPAFLMYQWTMDSSIRIEVLRNFASKSDAIGIRWIIVLFVAMCCAMRLARFNTMADENPPPYWQSFFMGVPAPAGAALATFPLMLSLATKGEIELFRTPVFVGFFLILSGIMMASKIPTICLKHIHLSEEFVPWIRMLVLIIIAGLACFRWIVLSILCSLYILFLPIGVILFLKFKKQFLKGNKKK